MDRKEGTQIIKVKTRTGALASAEPERRRRWAWRLCQDHTQPWEGSLAKCNRSPGKHSCTQAHGTVLHKSREADAVHARMVPTGRKEMWASHAGECYSAVRGNGLGHLLPHGGTRGHAAPRKELDTQDRVPQTPLT